MLILQKRLGLGVSTPWDLTNASYTGTSIDLSSHSTDFWSALAFSADGTQMYVGNRTNAFVYQYALSVAWDLSTAVYTNNSYSTPLPDGITFSPDGTKLFTGTAEIFQSNLSVAWDLSTATVSGISLHTGSPGAPEGSVGGLRFSSDGLVLYGVSDNTGDDIWQRTLNSPYDIANGSWNGTRSGVATPPRDLAFNNDFSKVFIADSSVGQHIRVFSVNTPGDITNLSPIFAEEISITSLVPTITSFHGLTFNSAGTKFYVLDNTTDSVYQFVT